MKKINKKQNTYSYQPIILNIPTNQYDNNPLPALPIVKTGTYNRRDDIAFLKNVYPSGYQVKLNSPEEVNDTIYMPCADDFRCGNSVSLSSYADSIKLDIKERLKTPANIARMGVNCGLDMNSVRSVDNSIFSSISPISKFSKYSHNKSIISNLIDQCDTGGDFSCHEIYLQPRTVDSSRRKVINSKVLQAPTYLDKFPASINSDFKSENNDDKSIIMYKEWLTTKNNNPRESTASSIVSRTSNNIIIRPSTSNNQPIRSLIVGSPIKHNPKNQNQNQMNQNQYKAQAIQSLNTKFCSAYADHIIVELHAFDSLMVHSDTKDDKFELIKVNSGITLQSMKLLLYKMKEHTLKTNIKDNTNKLKNTNNNNNNLKKKNKELKLIKFFLLYYYNVELKGWRQVSREIDWLQSKLHSCECEVNLKIMYSFNMNDLQTAVPFYVRKQANDVRNFIPQTFITTNWNNSNTNQNEED